MLQLVVLVFVRSLRCQHPTGNPPMPRSYSLPSFARHHHLDRLLHLRSRTSHSADWGTTGLWWYSGIGEGVDCR